MNSTIERTSDTVILICTTPYSKRIPQKCFQKINGRPALEHILCRIKSLKLPIALLTPLSIDYKAEYSYKNLAQKYNCDLFKGDDDSPLHRMAAYLKDKPYKHVIRITHDDLLIDDITAIELLKNVQATGADYGCTPTIVEGAGVEVIKASIIREQAEKITFPVEHVSYFVKGQKQVNMKPRMRIERDYRLTMDYPEDVVVLESLLKYIGNDSTIEKVCKYIDANPLVLKYNELPEVSVYTCMRNASKWIVECISSVFLASRVSGTKIEYIIIDDDSQDDTLIKALSQIGMWDNTKCTVLTNRENIGLASSSNIALRNARGKYILRVDADDMLEPTAIKQMLQKIKKDDSVLVYPSYYEYYGDGEYNIMNGWIYHHAGGALMKKRVINELKFKEGLKHWDSFELYSRISEHKLKISYLPEPLFKYRKHPGSLSASGDTERMTAFESIMKNIRKAQ